MTREEHDYIEHGKQFDNVPEDCTECDGSGKVYFSECCGANTDFDDILNEMFCMDCLKKCNCELDTCEECKGTGEVEVED